MKLNRYLTAGTAGAAAVVANLATLCGAALYLGAVGAACAQSFPVKPLRIIVGSAAGGGVDFVARIVAARLTEALGQQVIIDNRPGAGGSSGAEYALRQPPDGYCYVMMSPAFTILPALYPVRDDILTDYTPVVNVAQGPLVVTVHPSVPAKTLKELIVVARARPGQLAYGSAGQGSVVHLATELFLEKTGIRIVHVPYKGGGLAMTDLIAGQVQLVFATPQLGLQQAKAGRVRALAVTTAERISAAPELPTIAEAGVPGYEVSNWLALIGPRGLPPAVVERVNGEVRKILRMKDVEERLRGEGMSATGSTPEELHALIQRESAQWKQVVQHAGIKIQ